MDASPASTTLRGSVSKNAALYMPEMNMPPMMRSPAFMTRPARKHISFVGLRQAGGDQPTKSDSIWKSMSLACALYRGVPVSSGAMPRLSARRAARLACHSLYLASRTISPKSAVVAFNALVNQHFREGHVDVKIVLVERLGDHFRFPHRQFVGPDVGLVETELSERAEADADH